MHCTALHSRAASPAFPGCAFQPTLPPPCSCPALPTPPLHVQPACFSGCPFPILQLGRFAPARQKKPGRDCSCRRELNKIGDHHRPSKLESWGVDCRSRSRADSDISDVPEPSNTHLQYCTRTTAGAHQISLASERGDHPVTFSQLSRPIHQPHCRSPSKLLSIQTPPSVCIDGICASLPYLFSCFNHQYHGRSRAQQQQQQQHSWTIAPSSTLRSTRSSSQCQCQRLRLLQSQSPPRINICAVCLPVQGGMSRKTWTKAIEKRSAGTPASR